MNKFIPNIKAIDVHIHFGKGACSYRTETEELIKYMDILGVEWALGSAFEALIGNYIEGNEFAIREVKKFKDRLKAYLVINPNYTDNLTSYIEGSLSEEGYCGLKLHTDLHGHSPVSDKVLKIYELASKYSLPVLSHNFGPYAMAGDIAMMFPKLKMIMAHGTSRIKIPNVKSEYDNVKALALKVKDHKGFYIDTATSMIPYGANETFAELFGTEKILFGSDLGFIDPAFSIARIYGGEFNDNQKQMILRQNAVDLFGL